MAETSGITVDDMGFRRQVDDFARRYGLDAGIVMRDQMRLWAEDLVRNTPHKSATRKKVGDAIMRQLKSIFGRFRRASSLTWFRKKMIDGSWGGDVTIFDEVNMAAHHRQRRGVAGKVRPLKKSIRVGSWTFGNKPQVSAREFNAYARKVKARIGQARAAWLPALIRWRGRMPASWITRHGSRFGRTLDRMMKDGSGFLLMAGKFKYNVNSIRSMVKFTARKRKNDLDRHLQKRLDKLVAQENMRKAA